MEPANTFPPLATTGTEGGPLTSNESPSPIGDHTKSGDSPSLHQSTDGRTQRHVHTVLFLQTATYVLVSVANATTGGHPRREDDVASLTRFVRHVSTVYSYLSVVDFPQIYRLIIALQRCRKTRRQMYSSMSTLNSPGVADTKAMLS